MSSPEKVNRSGRTSVGGSAVSPQKGAVSPSSTRPQNTPSKTLKGGDAAAQSPSTQRNAPRRTSRSPTTANSRVNDSHNSSTQPPPAPGAGEANQPRYGRRAAADLSAKEGTRAEGDAGMGESGGASGWFEAERKRPKDQIVGALPTVSDGVDEKSRLEQMKKSKEAREALAQQIASAPTGYHASLPRLSDLDITHNWDKLLETIHREFDMSCLTACLARELDEDITWNPDMLLVQLTSDLMDAAELKNDGPGGNGFATDDDVAIGMMSGGEVVRKRREKGAISPEPADGNGNAAGGAAAPPASKRISLATAADGGGGGNAAVPSAPRKGIPGKPSSPAAKKASPAPQNSAARPSVSAKPNANATPRQGAAAVGPSKSPSKAAKKE